MEICVDEASVLCYGLSDCCVAGGGMGCDDIACQEAVCQADPFCCDVSWDSICAGEAGDLCAVCGACAGAESGIVRRTAVSRTLRMPQHYRAPVAVRSF